MTYAALVQVVLYFVALTALVVPLGGFLARVYSGEARLARRFWGPLELWLYRLAGVRPEDEMDWRGYARAVLAFGFVSTLAVYLLQRLQGALPLNPAGLGPVSPRVAFNAAVSFATNTNWQAYAGERTMSHLTQLLAFTVQNFLSAATGMAVAAALARGFARRCSDVVGNFWVDLVRGTLYVLVPLSLALALALVSQGVPQTYQARAEVEQVALGPVASQVAIKQLGTNGGGFYNANSAHPFENPTPLTDFAEALAILLLPGAWCFAFGATVGSRRHGWMLYAAMTLVVVPCALLCLWAEQAGNPRLAAVGVDQAVSDLQSGGNMEGKEVRFGVARSALWATVTTAASNGSVDAMHDSFTPLGGLVPLVLMQLGEVVFGGVGSGLYGMLMFVVVAVFLAGLMVGRTPELLGKKLEAFEMKMASLVILVPAGAALVGTALACGTAAGRASLANGGAHGFSEMLYAFSSAANNNGSAFAGLDASTYFYTVATGLCMLLGRFWVIVPVLAVAGSLARKKKVPPSAGTLPTDTPLFTFLLVGVVLLVGALTFVPALALGPVVEHLELWSPGGR